MSLKYRVRKIWFDDGGARYDLNELSGTTVNDLASVAGQKVMNTNGISMTGQARAALYAMIRYEIVAHCWGTKWDTRHAADIFVETISGWSSSAMMAKKLLNELTSVGFLLKQYNPNNLKATYTIDYKFIAERSKVEFIPEAYDLETH